MHKFVRNLLTEWRKLNLPFEGETFIIAVSGGADSVSLLLAIKDLRERKKLRNRFVVAHFNHDLRGGESAKDAEFVKELCENFDFELAYKIQNSNFKIQDQKGNLEQNARRARYAFLKEIAENLHARGVLTAHTINDQAETFLINLLRGSGLQGLSGMKAIRFLDVETGRQGDRETGQREDGEKGGKGEEERRDFEFQDPASEIKQSQIANCKSQILLVRPLLNWAKRIDTENFCRENQIEPRYDTMNEDLAFKRVRVRKVLLPMLEDFNPKIVEALANTANLLRRESEVLEGEKGRGGEGEAERQSSEISLAAIKKLPESKLYSVLRQWLKENRGNLRGIELKHIEALARLAFSRKSGKTAELPNGEIVVKEDGKLIFKNFKVEK
jgi:tRNA(Ile)-lysidine synthase